MKISSIGFKNNFKLNNTQTRTKTLGLTNNKVSYNKNISFKGELKSEQEILEFEKEAQEASKSALEEAEEIQEKVAQELKIANEIKAQIADMSLVLYGNNELVIGRDSIKYRMRNSQYGVYDEYEFDMDAKIKSISKGVRSADKMGQEIEERYSFDENQQLRTAEYFFKMVPVTRKQKGFNSHYSGGYIKRNSWYTFSNGNLENVSYLTTYNVAERTRAKNCIIFENGKLTDYMSDYINGNFGCKYTQGIFFGEVDGTFEYKKGYSNTRDGIKCEQTSSFKNGKMYKTV